MCNKIREYESNKDVKLTSWLMNFPLKFQVKDGR